MTGVLGSFTAVGGQAVSTMGDVMTSITSTPWLLFFVAIGLVAAIVGILTRVLRVSK